MNRTPVSIHAQYPCVYAYAWGDCP
jgi:hypothetical protein